MICQPNNRNMLLLQMLEKLSALAIYYRLLSDGPTGISNTAPEYFSEYWNLNQNVCQNVVCKMSNIFSGLMVFKVLKV